MSYTVILRVRYRSYGRDGSTSMRESSSREDLTRLIQAFGHAVAVREGDDEWQVDCDSQRGERGAFRLHQMACARNILVHIA